MAPASPAASRCDSSRAGSARPGGPSTVYTGSSTGARWVCTSTPPMSAGVVLAGVPVGLGRVVRPVVDLQQHRLLLGPGRPVHAALRVPVERPGGERDAGGLVRVPAAQAAHELV